MKQFIFAIGILVVIWGGFDFYFHTHIVAGVLSALQTALQMLFA